MTEQTHCSIFELHLRGSGIWSYTYAVNIRVRCSDLHSRKDHYENFNRSPVKRNDVLNRLNCRSQRQIPLESHHPKPFGVKAPAPRETAKDPSANSSVATSFLHDQLEKRFQFR